ncbi:condensation domain-containing protein [Kitasatospora sp. NBC_00240]|uniref:condensation domain-containing protein n=1 Tax=Kitasatospora sp. NBC_00240 TaxID=2903567 RepID=UPI00225A999E|nr:condensation domain-containing protein [Kitasatospora sp. NBC_00240]MCX5214610.1 condensation domain-containing protein [Kitasatospora sp. NBC_00240]
MTERAIGQQVRLEKVEFGGQSSGTAPLTWGQRATWSAIDRTRPGDWYFNFCRTMLLPRRYDLPQVLAAIRFVLERHESLRTRLVATDGEPRQSTSAAGVLEVEVLEVAAGDREAGARVAERYAARGFDYEREWPVRIAVLTKGGVPAELVLAFCHLAADYEGTGFLLRDVRAALAGRTAGLPPAPRPSELALYQESPEGRKFAEAAAAHWERSYRRIPVSMFTEGHHVPAEPRYQRMELLSPALAVAVPAVAARLAVSTSTVLLAAAGAVLRDRTGHDTCAMLAIAGNRVAPPTREIVSTMSLEALVVLPLEGVTGFEEAVRVTGRAAMAGYRFGSYDERDRDRVVAAESARRGEPVHPYCCVNDLRGAGQGVGADGVPTGVHPGELLERTRLLELSPLEQLSCRFCLHFADAPGALSIRLTADTGYLPLPDLARFLREAERLLVAAYDGDVPLAALGVAGPANPQ